MSIEDDLPATWSATENAGTPSEHKNIVPGSWWRIAGDFNDLSKREAPKHGLIFLMGEVRVIDGVIHTVVLHEHPRFGVGTMKVLYDDLLLNFTHEPDGERLRETELAELMSEINQITALMSSPPSDAELIKTLPAPPSESLSQSKTASVPSVLLPGGDLNAAQRKVETAIAVLEARQTWVQDHTTSMQTKMHLVANFQKEKVSVGLAGISEQRKWAESMLANVQTMRLWLGEDQGFSTLVEGQGANPGDKLHFMQRMLFLDEEIFTHSRIDGFNGDEMRDLPQLMRDNPELVERMLPFKRCVAIAKVRRSSRPFDPPKDAIGFMSLMAAFEQDEKIHILIRNGQQVSMVTTDEITSKAKRLFPSKAEIEAIFTERARFGSEARMITPQDIEYSDKRADHDSRALFYKRVLLILWGLAERENIFGEFIGKGENWLEQDVHARSFTFIHDEEGVIHDGRPGVVGYLDANRSRIRPGSRVLVQWSKALSEDVAPQIYDHGRDSSHVYLKVKLEETFGLTVAESRGDTVIVKCPVSKLSYRDDIKPYLTPVKMVWDDQSWGKFNRRHPEGFICIDEASADDLRYYFNSRIHRKHYLDYLHLFDEALRILEREEKECAVFLARVRDAGVDDKIAHSAISLWRTASKGAIPEGDKAYKKVLQLSRLITTALPGAVKDAYYADLTATGTLEVSFPHDKVALGEEYHFTNVEVYTFGVRNGWQKKSERIAPLQANAGPGALRLYGEAPERKLAHMVSCLPVFRDIAAFNMISQGPDGTAGLDDLEAMIDPEQPVDVAGLLPRIKDWIMANSDKMVMLPYLRSTLGYARTQPGATSLYRFEAYVDPIVHLMLKGEEAAVWEIYTHCYNQPEGNFEELKTKVSRLKEKGKGSHGVIANVVRTAEEVSKDPYMETATLGTKRDAYFHVTSQNKNIPDRDAPVFFKDSLFEMIVRVQSSAGYIRAPETAEKMLEKMAMIEVSFYDGCAEFLEKLTGVHSAMPQDATEAEHAPDL